MSNYTKATNFAIKDSLVTTDPAKIIKGTDLDNEFNAISSAVSSKADVNSPALTGTPTAPTATLGTNTTQIASCAFAIANGVPSGVILLWSGSVESIPSGWVFCNGSNGTPDLRSRFVVGADTTATVGGTGGSANAVVVSHTHTATSTVSDSGHNHTYSGSVSQGTFGYSGGSGLPQVGTPLKQQSGTDSATTNISVGTSISTEGVSATNANLPPYYSLAYIMKS
jgi:hypothetical protein